MEQDNGVTIHQQRVMEFLLGNLRKNKLPGLIELDGSFLLGYVFALQCPDPVKERLRSLVRNAADYARNRVDWSFTVPGGRT